MIGREVELAGLNRLLAADVGVISVVGAPGVGKSTLARAAWEEHTTRSAGAGVACIAASLHRQRTLASLSPGGAGASSPADMATAYAERAGDRPLHLWLDGVEGAWEQAREITQATLARGGRVLVTSQRPLQLPEERTFRLGPPSPEDAAAWLAAEALRQGLRLPIDPEDASVRALLAAVDGHPLAVSWLASLLPTSGVALLVEAVRGRGLSQLGFPSTAEAVGEALAWSWSLLDDEPRALVTRLAWFGRSFDHGGAFEVAGGVPRVAFERLLLILERSSWIDGEPTTGRMRIPQPLRAWLRSLEAEGHADAVARVVAVRSRELVDHRASAGSFRDAREDLEELADDEGVPIAARAAAVVALAPSVQHGEPLPQQERRITRMLDQRAELDADLVPRLLQARGAVCCLQGQLDEALEHLQSARLLVARRGDRQLEASILLDLATVSFARGDFDAARDGYLMALRRGGRHLDFTLRGRLEGNLALTLAEQGDLRRAERHYERGLALHRRSGDDEREGRALVNLANLLVERRDDDAARETLARATAIHVARQDLLFEGLAHSTLGNLEVLTGHPEKALPCYDRAVELHAQIGFPVGEGRSRAWRAAARALVAGPDVDLAGARADLAEAQILLEAAGPPGLAETAYILEAVVDLREGLAHHDASAVERAQAVFAWAGRPTRGPGSEPTRRSMSTRQALQVLSRAFQDLHAPTAEEPAVYRLRATPEARTLVLDGATIDLSRRGPARCIVLALLEARLRRPGTPLTTQELIEAGWPGEKILPRAARNRLHVTLNTLRRLGLRTILQRRDDGVVIPDDLSFCWMEPSASEGLDEDPIKPLDP